MTRMRVAALQMCASTEPADNLATLERLVAEAAAEGADYVLTPEMSVAFAEDRAGLALVAEPFEGNTAVAALGALAARHRLFLHLGSLAVALGDGHYANRSVLFSPDGAIAAYYDKIHLFDATLPGVRQYRESATYRGGDRAVLARAGDVAVGMTVCYDLRFAALYRALAAAGAELLAVPAAFTVPTGAAHWEVLVRARAIETGCYVVASAQSGSHANGRQTYGHSLIVDPWGRVLAQLGDETEGVIVAPLERARVAEARAAVPALDNGRSFSLSLVGDSPGQAAS